MSQHWFFPCFPLGRSFAFAAGRGRTQRCIVYGHSAKEVSTGDNSLKSFETSNGLGYVPIVAGEVHCMCIVTRADVGLQIAYAYPCSDHNELMPLGNSAKNDTNSYLFSAMPQMPTTSFGSEGRRARPSPIPAQAAPEHRPILPLFVLDSIPSPKPKVTPCRWPVSLLGFLLSVAFQGFFHGDGLSLCLEDPCLYPSSQSLLLRHVTFQLNNPAM